MEYLSIQVIFSYKNGLFLVLNRFLTFRTMHSEYIVDFDKCFDDFSFFS